jgi:hypothetical protein
MSEWNLAWYAEHEVLFGSRRRPKLPRAEGEHAVTRLKANAAVTYFDNRPSALEPKRYIGNPSCYTPHVVQGDSDSCNLDNDIIGFESGGYRLRLPSGVM